MCKYSQDVLTCISLNMKHKMCLAWLTQNKPEHEVQIPRMKNPYSHAEVRDVCPEGFHRSLVLTHCSSCGNTVKVGP